MSRKDEVFEPALIGRKIPILTLDHKWHQLFTHQEYTPEIKGMEDELNGLLKRQGKVNEDHKEIKKLKKMMMDEIVVLADELVRNPTNRKLEKKQEECKRMVEECNEKLDACEDEMVELPRRINQLNNKLMLATMEICYRKLQKNTEELTEIEGWIASVRRELKKKIIRKQEKEAMNHRMYAYMHDIFGAEVMELFDMKYNPEERYQKAKEAKTSNEAKEENEAKADKGAEEKSGGPEAENGMNSENASKS